MVIGPSPDGAALPAELTVSEDAGALDPDAEPAARVLEVSAALLPLVHAEMLSSAMAPNTTARDAFPNLMFELPRSGTDTAAPR
ncbi:MAG: hypothetical protein ABJD68_04280 [Nakamurella sp.]